MIHQELLEIVAAQTMKMCVNDGRGAARSLAAIKDRQLSKEVSRFQFSQGYFLDVFVEHPDSYGSFFQDVERVAAIVLVKDCFAGWIINLIDFFSEMFQLMRLQPLKKGNTRKALRFVAKIR